jgi:hypothetical protein
MLDVNLLVKTWHIDLSISCISVVQWIVWSDMSECISMEGGTGELDTPPHVSMRWGQSWITLASPPTCSFYLPGV